MSFRDKAQIVVVSVVIALALAAGLYYFVPGPSLGPGGTRGGTDDQPIIMAGGSLYIGTGDVAKFKPAGNTLDYTKAYKVFQIDVLYMNDATAMYMVNQDQGAGKIEIAYCKNTQQCNNDKDTVTLTFNNDNTNQFINITNDLTGNKPISMAPRILPTLRTHMRKKWSMSSVTVTINGNTDTPKTFSCGPDSECEVEVHTCLAGNTCPI